MKGIVCLVLMVALLPAGAAWAQTQKNKPGDEVIITASKIEESVGETGSSVIVITREEIEKKRYDSVISAIKGQLGVSTSSSGPFGGTTALNIRGTESSAALVTIDGIRIYDAVTADGNLDLAVMSLDNVERIEILKGPQSSLYGSDAMGGVVNIITRKGSGDPRFFLQTEIGTKDTYSQNIGGYGRTGQLSYSFDASHFLSDGISKARDGAEQDNFERSSFNSRMVYSLNDSIDVGLQGFYIYARSEIDDGASQDDPNRMFETERSLASIFVDHDINDVWDHKLQYSWYRNNRWDNDDADEIDTTESRKDFFKGWVQDVTWQHNVDMTTLLGLSENLEDVATFGVEHISEEGRSRTFATKNANTTGYFLQNKFGLNDKFFWTAAVRLDDHSRFGSKTTGRTSVSYLFDTNTRFKGSYGTGFNAPSLFQLFSSFGDPNLNPEESHGYDVGLEQTLFDEKVFVSALYFYNRFKNLIEFDSPTSTYVNVGKARTNGIESAIEYRPLDNLSLKYAFTYLEARNLQDNQHLRRRPNLSHSLSFDLSFWEKFGWNVDVRRNLKTFDPATTRQKDYTVVDTALNYDVNDDVTAYVKVDNVFNTVYTEVRGFSNLPRYIRVGTVIKF